MLPSYWVAISTWHQDFRGGSGGYRFQIADLGCSRPSYSHHAPSLLFSYTFHQSFTTSSITVVICRHLTLLACFDRGKHPNQQLQPFAIIIRNLISPVLYSSKVFLYDFLLLILDQNSTHPVLCIIRALEKTCQGIGLEWKSSAFN